MNMINIAAIVVTLAGVFAYINHRFLRFPTTIGLMLITMVISLVIIGMGKLGFHFNMFAQDMLRTIDFDKALMQGMLSFLLFAGALHVNLNDLAKQKWVITLLATLGVVVSTLVIGFAGYWLLGVLGLGVPLIYCLLLGALISPTDPIAVLSIVKTAGASKSLETKITGESLFNDGVAVVVFLTLMGVATGGHDASVFSVSLLFVQETLGGVVFGLVAGYITFLMLRGVDNYQVEVLITLALVMGGYALAGALHLSAPIAIVVAGLLIGNHGRLLGMSKTTREHLDPFWELIDGILNAVLFVLIGLEILIIRFHPGYLWAGLLMVPLVLAARFVSVSIPVTLLRRRRRFSPNVIKILTWGGLRGGISVAMALSLPAGSSREAILTITYMIVVFSIFVQGLTVGRLFEGQQKYRSKDIQGNKDKVGRIV